MRHDGRQRSDRLALRLVGIDRQRQIVRRDDEGPQSKARSGVAVITGGRLTPNWRRKTSVASSGASRINSMTASCSADGMR
ncbi:MAG: hypothetical protein QM621_01185 [Aeromicrobium sp.]|uniref:hypothetical protein n=1 Tax=Aeromicrobium sp. TaxID=1871063 RepID=UPI0039E61EB5